MEINTFYCALPLSAASGVTGDDTTGTDEYLSRSISRHATATTSNVHESMSFIACLIARHIGR
jgi:hypothetical protein